MLIKLVFFILIVYFIWYKFFRKKPENNNINSLVQCFKCETYISPDDSIKVANKYYCSRECLGK